MTWGNPTARWGFVEWGDLVEDPSQLAQVAFDCLGSATDQDVDVSFDAVAEAQDNDAEVSFDALAEGSGEVGCAFDAYTYSLPPGWEAHAISPLLLVEIRLRGGTMRVASRDVVAAGYAWDGRIAAGSPGTIMRSLAKDGTDSMSFELEDTGHKGRPRFSALFEANPPEGCGVSVYLALDGGPVANVMHVWEGRIDRIPGVSLATVRIDCLRTEVAADRLLGSVVSATDYPNAPPDSLGRMLPIVFGTLPDHEGVVVASLARGTLAQNVLSGDLSLVLQDASSFPTSGVVLIEAERIAYNGKAGNTLTGLIRSYGISPGILPRLVNAARPVHPKGATVAQVGSFLVRFSGHALGRIERLRILDSNGDLGTPVPEPNLVNPSGATVLWSEMPRIRAQNPATVYQRVQFGAAATTNEATNPEHAARSAAGYDAMGYADLTTGPLVLETKADGLGRPGDIVSVWLGVIFDPTTIGPPGGARVVMPTGDAFSLVPADTVPDEIARNDERTGDRLYEVVDPITTVEPETESQSISPTTVVSPGIWATIANASQCIDGNEDTAAETYFAGAGEVAIIGSGLIRFKINPPPNLENFVVKTARLVFVGGRKLIPFTSRFTVVLAKDDGTGVFRPIEATRVDAQSYNNSSPLGRIDGISTFSRDFDPALLGAELHLEELGDCEWWVDPEIGTANGIWVGRELRIEITTQRADNRADLEVTASRTVTNYFEIGGGTRRNTRAAFFSPRSLQGDTATAFDWDFFTDDSRGGQVRVEAIGAAAPRIVEAFWVVKFNPFEDITTGAPRVFADVSGLVPGGNPVDIAEAIVTTAVPIGMGLTADAIDAARYMRARASVAADGIRADFAIRERTSAVELLGELADQTDLGEGWELGRHALVRKVEADVLLDATRTIDTSGVIGNTMKRSRTALDDVVTRIQGRHGYSQAMGAFSGSFEVVSSAAETLFGRIDTERRYALLQDAATALLVATRELGRRSKPRWSVSFECPPFALEVRQGDIVAVAHRDFAAAVCEVTSLNIGTSDRFIRVLMTLAVWRQA